MAPCPCPTCTLQVSGQLIIETFQGMSFLQAVQFGRGTIPPLVMKQNMAYMNQCAPFRLRGIWIYHQSTVLSILMVGLVGGRTGLTEPQGCPACDTCQAGFAAAYWWWATVVQYRRVCPRTLAVLLFAVTLGGKSESKL